MAAGDVRYLLTEEDKALVEEVIADYLVRNPGRNRPDHRAPAGESSSTLLVRTPEGGVPSLNTADTTGTAYQDAEDDTPGAAYCQVYRVVKSNPETTGTSGPDVPVLFVARVPGRFELVVNMSTVTLGAGQWLLIHRDRYGTWFAGSVLGIEFAEC